MTYVKLICKLCKSVFETPLKTYNYRIKKKNNDNHYCSRSCFIKDKKCKVIYKKCALCNVEFISNNSVNSKKCCSKSCASKYSKLLIDDETNSLIISTGVKNWWKNRNFKAKIRKCKFCKNILKPRYYRKCCSIKCAKELISMGGRNSAKIQSINRRSKNEMYFFELCNKKFNDVVSNKQMFNGWDADVILPNEKVAVLWNGKWHYEKLKMKHSVKQVQNRDMIKTREIINFGYVPYVIKDLGKENKNFVESEFEKFCNFLLTSNKVSV